jgi:hypothetical protein
MRTPEETALHLIAKYGFTQARDWAIHFAYNNYDEEDAGRTYWLIVAEEVKRLEREKRK